MASIDAIRLPAAALKCGVAAVVAALAPGVAAQSITLYGTADAGIAFQRTDAPGAGTVTAVSSGVLSASRWGVRGSEELGDGLRAIFQLEAGLDLDTGAAKAYSGNPATATPSAQNGVSGTGFNRRSYAGLASSRYGTLALGRDYTPLYHAGLNSDIFRLGLFGNLQQIAQPAGGAERFAWVSNGVFYTSPTWAGLQGRAVYSFGSESAGGAGGLPRHANEFAGLGLQYAVGGLAVNASYQVLRFPRVAGTPPAFTGATERKKDGLIGAKYSFGDFAVAAGYWEVGSPQNASNRWLGASMKIGRGTVLAQVQGLQQDNPAGAERKATVWALGYVYNMSQRTALYSSYGSVANNATAAFALVASDVAVAAGRPGADPSALAFGMRHSF